MRARSVGRLLPWVVGPAAVLVAGAFVLTFSVLLWTGWRADEEAAAQQRSEFGGALQQMLQGMRLRLAEATSEGPSLRVLLDDPVIKAAERPLSYLEFTGLFVFAVDDGPLPHAVQDREPLLGPVVDRLRARMREPAPGGWDAVSARAEAGVARLVYDGGVYAVVAAPLPPHADGHHWIAVACRNFSEQDLRDVADMHSIFGLRLATAAVENGLSVPILGTGGQPAVYMVWDPSHPGEALRRDLLPPLAVGGLAVLALLATLVSYKRWVARVLERYEVENDHLINRDPLSGLFNRRMFCERVDVAALSVERDGLPCAVLFIDLDRFKAVNDTLGHAVGDRLITEVALRLGGVLRAGDVLARFGGDEFAILQTVGAAADGSRRLAARVLDVLNRPFDLGGTAVSVGASIGIAVAPGCGTDRGDLMRRADIALYEAKTAGRNRFQMFEPEMEERVLKRGLVEAELRRAIDDDGLHLVYQPIVAASDGRLVAVEALLRWDHPTRGPIEPDHFIPVAEERGLMGALGEWVLRRACRDSVRWPGVALSINVSPLQFRRQDFVDSIARVLIETGFDPGRLELELTEQAVVAQEATAREAMDHLRGLGIRMSLDDFGKGYSSLVYLRRFPFDAIKIDRSFVEGVDVEGEASIIMESMVRLGRALGLTVTAEGVETAAQEAFLKAVGCDRLQGFRMARPQAAEAIDAALGRVFDARAA